MEFSFLCETRLSHCYFAFTSHGRKWVSYCWVSPCLAWQKTCMGRPCFVFSLTRSFVHTVTQNTLRASFIEMYCNQTGIKALLAQILTAILAFLVDLKQGWAKYSQLQPTMHDSEECSPCRAASIAVLPTTHGQAPHSRTSGGKVHMLELAAFVTPCHGDPRTLQGSRCQGSFQQSPGTCASGSSEGR